MRPQTVVFRVVPAALVLCGALCFASRANAQVHDAALAGDAHVTPLTHVATVSYARPPEPRIASRSAMPYPHAVWVEGYWDWTGSEYVWRDGHWTAPHAGMHWRDTHWQPFGDGWVRVPGQWVR